MQDISVYDWYNCSAIRFEMIRFLYKREMVMLSKDAYKKSVRMLKCHSVQHFAYITKNMICMEAQRLNYNFYYSLAKYKDGIPNQAPNLALRDNSQWNEKHWYEMTDFDFLLDIDSPSFNELDLCYDSTKEIKRWLDRRNVPYELRFSGCGFHIVIPSMYFPYLSLNPDEPSNTYNLHNAIARYFFNNFSEMVDYSIYDSRRVVKIPYSLSLYDEGNYMCLPFLSDREFQDFELDKYKHGYIDPVNLRCRGTKLFNGEEGRINYLIKEVEKYG